MNIALLSFGPFKPGIAGVESYTYWAAQQLQAAGHRVLCLTMSPLACEEGFSAEVVRLNGADNSWQEHVTLLLKEREVEVLWLHTLSLEYVAACRRSCDAAGAKFIFHLHLNPLAMIAAYRDCLAEAWFDCCRGRRILSFLYDLVRYPLGYEKRMLQGRRLYRFIYEHADAVVLLSSRFQKEFCRVAGLRSGGKLRALSNPLLIAPPEALPPKRKEILYVGRLPWQHKRVDRILRAWHLLEAEFPDWQLTIVGDVDDGDGASRYQELSRDLHLQRVSFEGLQVPDAYYARASIFCMSSSNEGFGLVLTEAQAAGCVPVAFDSYSAVHDIIEDGVNGCLVKPFDIKAYADTLRRLMGDEAKLAAMSAAARESVKRFTSERIFAECEKLLQEVSAS